MKMPTQAAIEAARERLANAAEANGLTFAQKLHRDGCLDDEHETQALAIALQEMSEAVKGAGNSRYLSRDAKDAIATALAPFVLPDPVVDPLALALEDVLSWVIGGDDCAKIREALADLGLQIVPVQS